MGRRSNLFVTTLAFSALMLSICITHTLPAAARNAADPLEQAESALQRHNYAIALEATDDYLKAFPDGPKTKRARVIRALAKIGLKQFEEGVAEAETLLGEFADLAGDMELHEALAQVGEQRHDYRYLAVDHYETLTGLLLARGDQEEAARAQLKRGIAFIRFTDWKKAQSIDEAPSTDDWREKRRLQRKYAVQCFDRAASLTRNDSLWAEILSTKARVFARDLHLDDNDISTAIEVYQQIVERMARTNEAAAALNEIGELYESRKHDYLQAAIVYRRVLKMPGIRDSITHRARQRLERIEAPSFRMSVESPITPGEPIRLHWESRNIETIRFSVYRVDLLELASSYDLREVLDDEWKANGKIPFHEWTLRIPDERKHLVYGTDNEGLEPVAVPTLEPGAYVIVGEGEGLYDGDVRVVGLGLVSNITVLTYTGRERSLLWVIASDTGLPVAGATVHVYAGRGKERRLVREAKTDDAGL
ncbi:MAG: tetratricopeptide repeat protein, partial [Phycisphaerales bacterium]